MWVVAGSYAQFLVWIAACDRDLRASNRFSSIDRSKMKRRLRLLLLFSIQMFWFAALFCLCCSWIPVMIGHSSSSSFVFFLSFFLLRQEAKTPTPHALTPRQTRPLWSDTLKCAIVFAVCIFPTVYLVSSKFLVGCGVARVSTEL